MGTKQKVGVVTKGMVATALLASSVTPVLVVHAEGVEGEDTGNKLDLVDVGGVVEEVDGVNEQEPTDELGESIGESVEESELDGDGLVGMSEEDADTLYEYEINRNNEITILKLLEKGVNDLIVPDTIGGRKVTEIGENAFYKKKMSGGLTLPKELKEVGDGAFRGNSITEIRFGNSLKSIGKNAFMDNMLTKLNIPDTVTEVKMRAFEGNEIADLKLSSGMSKVEDSVFSGNKLTKLVLGSNIKEVGYRAFEENRIEEVNLGEVEIIGEGTFENNGIREINIPDTVMEIGGDAFRRNLIKKVEIPGTVKRIDGFRENPLEKVVIGDGADAVEGWAFETNKMKELHLPASITMVSEKWNFGSTIDGLLVYGEAGTYAENFARGLVGAVYRNVDDSVYEYDFENYEGSLRLTKFKGDTTEVDVPKEVDGYRVTRIGTGVFTKDGMEKVTIPNTVDKIENNAFSEDKGVNQKILLKGGNATKKYAERYGHIYEAGDEEDAGNTVFEDIDDIFKKGDGTELSPYEVSNREQLEFLGNKEAQGKHYKLVNDIDLTEKKWVPIPSFGGVIDGNNHKIIGMDIDTSEGSTYLGFIELKKAEDTLEIRNLEFEDVLFKETEEMTSDEFGTVVGKVEVRRDVDVNETRIENVKVTGGVITDKTSYVSGLVGSGDNITFKNVEVNMKVKGIEPAGVIYKGKNIELDGVRVGGVFEGRNAVGVVRYLDNSDQQRKLENITVTADIEGIAGVIGELSGDHSENIGVLLKNIEVTGNVHGETAEGGVVGKVDIGKGKMTLDTLDVRGVVGQEVNDKPVNQGTRRGGVIGQVRQAGDVDLKRIEFSGVLKDKNSVPKPTSNMSGYGGFIGSISSQDTDEVRIQNSKMSGVVDIQAATSFSIVFSGVGGFIGSIDNDSGTKLVIEDSKVTGDVKTDIINSGTEEMYTIINYVGGFVGDIPETGAVEVTRSSVTGDVGALQGETEGKLAPGNIGGFIGMVYRRGDKTAEVKITDSYFSGCIRGKEFMGGLIGFIGGSDNLEAMIDNTYVSGKIERIGVPNWGRVSGGFVGDANKKKIKISNSYVYITNLREEPTVSLLVGGDRVTGVSVDNVFTYDKYKQTDTIEGLVGADQLGVKYVSSEDSKKKETYTEQGWNFSGIWVNDEGEGLPYHGIVGTPVNHAPEISGQVIGADEESKVYDKAELEFTITHEDNISVDVDVTLNDLPVTFARKESENRNVKRANAAMLGQTYEAGLTDEQWEGLVTGETSVFKVVATDERGATATKAYTFVKGETNPSTPVEPPVEEPDIPWTPIEPSIPVGPPVEEPDIPWAPIEPSTPVEPPVEEPDIPWTPIEPALPVEPPKIDIPWVPIEPSTPVEEPEETPDVPMTPIEPTVPIDTPEEDAGVGEPQDEPKQETTVNEGTGQEKLPQTGEKVATGFAAGLLLVVLGFLGLRRKENPTKPEK